MNRTWILTTANICAVEPELCLSAQTKKGGVPVVPQLESQKDLMKIVSILLSTGINRNDDVFLPKEVLPVRNTGAHKPLNLEHDPTKIVGHMIRTYATEKGGKRVPDNKNPKSNNFDITAEAVLYKFLFPQLAQEVKERADAGELFVSVEVWFTDYDYLVGSKVVKRTAETSGVLESKLRINGGTGQFEGQRLSRVLRNMIIGGIGLVKDPANPGSIIKSVSNSHFEVVQDIEDKVIASNVLGGFDQLLEEEVTELENQEVFMTLNREVVEEMAALAVALKAKAEESETAEIEGIDQDDNPVLAKVLARLETLERESKEAKTKLEEAEFKAEAARRAEALTGLGLNDSLTEEHVTRSFGMNKEEFDEYVALLQKTLAGVTKSVANTETETVEAEENTTDTTNESADDTEGGDAEKAEETEEAKSEESNETVESTEVEAKEEAPEAPEADSAEEEVEETKEEEKADEAPETPTAETETEETDAETQDSANDEDDEEIDVDIEAVDPDLNVESDEGSKTSLTDQMADVVQQFLKRHDKRWDKLATLK